MQVRVVACERYRVRVTTWGSGAAPHAVVLPGLSADARALAPQIRMLRRRVATVHVVDLPGFALSPALKVQDARFSSLARCVARVADELGIESAIFVGHSLGGGVALHLALQRRALVSALVLIAPAALGRSLHWIYKLYCMPLVGRALLRPEPVTRRSFVRWFLVGRERRADDHFIDMLIRHGARNRERTLSTRAIVWANQPSWWRKLMLFLLPGGEQIAFTLGDRVNELGDTPTLVLWGSDDRVICAGDAKRCLGLPRADVRVAPRAGHSLPLELPAWTNEQIARFIDGLSAEEERAA